MVTNIVFVPKEIEATKGTKPPMNVPTTGINCERIPADTPKAIGEGSPIKRKETERIKLAKIPNINFASIKPAAFETPTFQTSSVIFQKE